MKYFIGILVSALGVCMVVKTQWFIENFGYSDWAESKLGGGGTRLMYKVLGILCVVGTVLVLTGALGEMFLSIFGTLFVGGARP